MWRIGSGETLGLRRRRQNASDKYVTDPAQLNLRFKRNREIMRYVPPAPIPPHSYTQHAQFIWFLLCSHLCRNRGVPSHLLGSGPFDDNSSDSTDGKPADSRPSKQCENGDGDDDDYAGNVNNNTDIKYDYLDDNHCDADDTGIQYRAKQSLTTADYEIGVDAIDGNDDEIVRQKSNHEIPPPPGEPRPENTARLRRYKLDVRKN